MRTVGQRYELAAEIASGGMASVHLARQVGVAGFARIVAVKRLHTRLARDPGFIAMFLDEARLVARIRHPNVVQTLDVVAEARGARRDEHFGADRELEPSEPEALLATAESPELFIVMEYVHGESLLRLLVAARRAGHLVPPKLAAAVVSAALHGLHAAHEARGEDGQPLGIVHRDVSPHNILVGVDGIARVLDFGVAKASARITTTHEGQLKGKLSYMAPEQVTAADVDRRTDVYGASVVLWELLTGTKLHHGPSEGAIVQQILTSTIRAPSHTNHATPPGIDAIVARGLARDPGDRFASAREMALALEQEVGVVPMAEIGAWVRATCSRELEMKAKLIASIEAKGSSQSLPRAVASLRSLAVTRDADGSPLQAVDALEPSAEASRAGGDAPALSAGPSLQAVPSGSIAPLYVSASPSGMRSLPPLPPAAAPPRDRAPMAFVALSAAVAMVTITIGGVLFLRERAQARRAASASVVDASDEAAAVASFELEASAGPSCPEGTVFVPGGRFFMGSDDGVAAEKPAHNVALPAFCMDRHEVSTDAYRACSERGDCKRAGQTNRWDGITTNDHKTYDPLCNAETADQGAHPINCVDWSMAERFCRAEGKRLPTEAEWEFAARGSDGRRFPWGDEAPTSLHLNACGIECGRWLDRARAHREGLLFADDDGWPTTAPVGSFPLGASKWGVEDVVGNVWEWVADRYGPYTAEDQVEPAGPEVGSTRVIRGGGWNGTNADWVRPTFRHQSSPETRSHGIGFRCAKGL